MAELMEFLNHILRYVAGVLIVSLIGWCTKLFLDVIQLKADVKTLQEQRKADLIERDTVLAMAQAVKNETTNLKYEFELKLRDLVQAFSNQQNEDRAMMKDMIHEVKNTLTELNTSIKNMQDNRK